MKTVNLKIDGMSCSACSNSLEKYLNKQEKIIQAEVNLVLACATISYEDSLTINEIEEMIKNSGFKSLGIFKLDESDQIYNKTSLIIFSILTIIILYLSFAHMFNFISLDNFPKIKSLTLLILTLPFIFYGLNIFKSGIKNIIYLSPNMDTLVTIGFSVSFIYSLVYTIIILYNPNINVHLYYDCCTVVILFINLGRTIEANAKQKTTSSIKDLVQITPNYAFLKKENEIIKVTIDEINIDDLLVSKIGERISVDGIVTSGYAFIDEAFLTGESKPIKKSPGDSVIAGSIVIDGNITYQAKKIGKDSTISEIVNLVVTATNSKAKISKIADKLSNYFVPTIILIAITTFIVYLLLKEPFSVAISTLVSILVVACPCALGLATPLSIVISTGTLAKLGVIIKKSTVLENATKTKAIVFDKTGTLTKGIQSINKIYTYQDNFLEYANALEELTTHPISNAFKKLNLSKNYEVNDFKVIDGIGLKGIVNKSEVFVGSSKLFNILNIENTHTLDEQELLKTGHTIVYVIIDNIVSGLIGIKDIIKDEAYNVINNLNKLNIKTVLLTGDNKDVATMVANELNIDTVYANVLPKEKLEIVSSLKNTYKHVIMVGDGINDAPALTIADIGISIGSGTDVAINASDVIIMNNDLHNIERLIRISKETLKNIKQNLFWAFFYNALMIPLAIGVFRGIGLTLNPMFAGIAMVLSSLTVTLNALRLIKRKKE